MGSLKSSKSYRLSDNDCCMALHDADKNVRVNIQQSNGRTSPCINDIDNQVAIHQTTVREHGTFLADKGVQTYIEIQYHVVTIIDSTIIDETNMAQDSVLNIIEFYATGNDIVPFSAKQSIISANTNSLIRR